VPTCKRADTAPAPAESDNTLSNLQGGGRPGPASRRPAAAVLRCSAAGLTSWAVSHPAGFHAPDACYKTECVGSLYRLYTRIWCSSLCGGSQCASLPGRCATVQGHLVSKVTWTGKQFRVGLSRGESAIIDDRALQLATIALHVTAKLQNVTLANLLSARSDWSACRALRTASASGYHLPLLPLLVHRCSPAKGLYMEGLPPPPSLKHMQRKAGESS